MRTVGAAPTAPPAPCAASGRGIKPQRQSFGYARARRRHRAAPRRDAPSARLALRGRLTRLRTPSALPVACVSSQAPRSITRDGSASVPESRPAPQREDARAHAGPLPASPVRPGGAAPAPARLPPADCRALRRGRSLPAGPSHATAGAPGAGAAPDSFPPLQLRPRRGTAVAVWCGSARSGAPSAPRAARPAHQARRAALPRGTLPLLPVGQERSNGRTSANWLLQLRFVLCCHLCFPRSYHRFFLVSSRMKDPHEFPSFVFFSPFFFFLVLSIVIRCILQVTYRLPSPSFTKGAPLANVPA